VQTILLAAIIFILELLAEVLVAAMEHNFFFMEVA